ncbi:MAG: hypothetical protein KF744_16655 [Taibaiella sp.]|nr:hypothetical protein [Taibaiella sp.]
MIEKGKKIFDLSVKALPLMYILGFCVINGHLSNFSYSEYNILSVAYLKAGVFFACFVLTYVVMTYYSFTKETMTDNLLKAWPSMLHSLYYYLFITSLIAVLLPKEDNLTHPNTHSSVLFLVATIGFVHYYFFITAGFVIKKIVQRSIVLYYIMLCAPFGLFLGYQVYYHPIVRVISLLGFAIYIFSFLTFGEIGDGNYSVRVITDAFLLIIIAFFFGKYAYCKIPMSYGGGKALKIVGATTVDISKHDSVANLDTFDLLHENEQIYLLRTANGNILQVQKSEMRVLIMCVNSN